MLWKLVDKDTTKRYRVSVNLIEVNRFRYDTAERLMSVAAIFRRHQPQNTTPSKLISSVIVPAPGGTKNSNYLIRNQMVAA